MEALLLSSLFSGPLLTLKSVYISKIVNDYPLGLGINDLDLVEYLAPYLQVKVRSILHGR